MSLIAVISCAPRHVAYHPCPIRKVPLAQDPAFNERESPFANPLIQTVPMSSETYASAAAKLAQRGKALTAEEAVQFFSAWPLEQAFECAGPGMAVEVAKCFYVVVG